MATAGTELYSEIRWKAEIRGTATSHEGDFPHHFPLVTTLLLPSHVQLSTLTSSHEGVSPHPGVRRRGEQCPIASGGLARASAALA